MKEKKWLSQIDLVQIGKSYRVQTHRGYDDFRQYDNITESSRNRLQRAINDNSQNFEYDVFLSDGGIILMMSI